MILKIHLTVGTEYHGSGGSESLTTLYFTHAEMDFAMISNRHDVKKVVMKKSKWWSD